MERFPGADHWSNYGKNSKLLCIFLVVLTLFTDASNGDPEDPCSVYDSCTVRQFFRTCSCESDCYRYETCCKDASKFDRMKDHPEKFHCYADGTPSPVFAKRTCSDDWNGNQHVREACVKKETVNTTSDFMSQVLVSSNKSDITYWNWNCALCNGESIHDIIFWTVQLSCFVDRLKSHLSLPEAKKNMAYNATGKHWGIMTGGQIFLPCSVNFFQPAFLMGRLRLCAPNIISSCPPNYRDPYTKQQCVSYHGERKRGHTGVYFKNVHCAKCNGVAVKDLNCFGRNYRTESFTEDYRVLKVVFNLNSWTGEHGETAKDCLVKNQRYDPFLRICRDLSLGITNVTESSFEYESLTGTGKATLVAPSHFLWLAMTIVYHAGKLKEP